MIVTDELRVNYKAKTKQTFKVYMMKNKKIRKQKVYFIMVV